MKSSKAIQFHESIRRRQIDEIFRARRKVQDMKFDQSINAVSQLQQVEIFSTLLRDLQSSILQLDYFQVLQNLKSLKKLLRQNSKFVLHQISKNQYQVLEKITQIFKAMLDSKLTGYQIQPMFHTGISILCIMSESSQIEQERVVKAGIIPVLGNILRIEMNHSMKHLSDMFQLLGNMVCQNNKITEIFLNTKIYASLFMFFSAVNPQPSTKITQEFLFMLRCIFDKLDSPPPFSPHQIDLSIQVACQSYRALILEGFAQNQTIQALLDSIQLLSKLIDLKMLNVRSSYIPYQQIIDQLNVSSCPFDLKKQILIFIDTVVFMDDLKCTGYLIRQLEMLMKMTNVEQSLKYISYNIIGNVALDRIFRCDIQKCLVSLRLDFDFNPNNKKLLNFVFNYFQSNNFHVESKMQEDIISTLYNKTHPQQAETLILVAHIWIGLLNTKDIYNLMPPDYLINNQEFSQCDTIRKLIQYKEDADIF